MSTIFISYAREDCEIAERLYDDLRIAGHTPWIDTRDLPIGANWRVSIERQIRKSDYFLAIISSNSLCKRGFVRREIRIALEVLQECPPGDHFVLPVRIDDCKPEDLQLTAINWVKIFPDYANALQRILGAVRDQSAMTAKGFFADVGVIVPDNVSAWSDDRLFEFIDTMLLPEALNRAERDYEDVHELEGRPNSVFTRAREKLMEVAMHHGIADRVEAYLNIKKV